MVRHTGTRHQPIIAYCPKYRIEGIDHMLDRRTWREWEHDKKDNSPR